MFQGDIAQFAPADLLLFLSHMNKEGVLTVRQKDTALSLSFRRNLIVDAACEAAEELVLNALGRNGAASLETINYLRQAREETGLPLTRILDDVKWLSDSDASKAMLAGVRETVFRLLLSESGEFQFTEIAVDENPHLAPLDGQALVMDLTREVDEYRELMRGLGNLDRPLRPSTNTPSEGTAEEKYVLIHACRSDSVEELLASAPFPGLSTAWAVSTAVENGWLEFATQTEDEDLHGSDQGATPGVFPAYRQGLRRLLQAKDDGSRVREVLNFAQTHCTQSILFGVQDGHLKRATVYNRDNTGRLSASDHRDPAIELVHDQVFHQALESGRPFVGTAFPSPVIEALGAEIPAESCALLPLGRLGSMDLLLFAVTNETSTSTGPLACLELLSWQIRPPQMDCSATPKPEVVSTETVSETSLAADSLDAVSQLVASIKDLPPMPNAVAQVLTLLSSADCKMDDLNEALSHDPALMARLIKVSNSSLYGGYQETGSLKQALVRLGMRTTRSVVVAASTRSLFPMDSTRTGLLGKALWEHAVQAGLTARRVAEFTRRADPDEAFAGGVLHDIGKVIILLNKPDEYFEVNRRLEQGASDSVNVEREVLGFDHTLVGDRLLENWGMPGNLRAVARWHHAPDQAGELADLVQVVACGELLSQALNENSGAGSRLQERLTEARLKLDLDERATADLEELLMLDLGQNDLLD